MTHRARVRFFMSTFVGIAFVSACTIQSERHTESEKSSVSMSFGGDSAGPAELGPDDVRIVSIDGALVLSVINDTVRMQLSDSLRNSVAADIRKGGDTADDPTGIAAMVTKSVSSVVKGAMGFTVRAAAKDVENLRYEDGHIRFDIRNSNAQVKSSGNNKNNAVFTEEDANKFIDAVKRAAEKTVAM